MPAQRITTRMLCWCLMLAWPLAAWGQNADNPAVVQSSLGSSDKSQAADSQNNDLKGDLQSGGPQSVGPAQENAPSP